ncbi:UNVERIFIED_CONTAM: hypothetical protein PYX00_008932 [Menopon gallinae]|uniref:Eukaryotic translation initiation factor 4E transporter n=1 Tax=Menopon gallinae TaxID=328185 RepID=A0AAW2H9J8_9NEOP
MLVVNSHLKDNERNDSIEQDNEMDSQVEKDHLEEGEIEEIEDAGVGKIPYKPEYQYSREELLKYSDHPLSRQRPIINDPNVDGLSCWLKSSNWNNYKRSDTPTERGDDSYKRRSNDPRERVRKEQDGIVLSPQRRSFNSGCFVTLHYSSPNNVVRPPAESAKEGPVRRIGSGRIINRDWEFRDKENNDVLYPQFKTTVGPSPRERDERFEVRRNYCGMSAEREVVRDGSRESLPREKELRADSRARDRMQRFMADRRRYESEEPEWFSGGPTSQHDTIELRGFEDTGEVNNRNKGKIASKSNSKPNPKDSKSNTGSRKSSSEEISVLKGGSGEAAGSKEVEGDSLVENPPQKADLRESPKAESETVPAEETETTENRDFNLNLEDFLQLDNLPLLSNGATGEGNQSSSRFSQWFRRDSPPDVTDSKRATAYDELIKNIINDISESSINIPTKESDTYFAPISPAGTTSGNSFLDMLKGQQRNEHRSKPPSIKDLEASGKVTNVEELEARMRQGAGQGQINQLPQNQPKKVSSSSRKEEELIAFKKLLKQVVEGGATLGAVSDPAIRNPVLNQMLNKPPEPSDMMGQAHQANAAPQMHVPQDLVYKLLHVQEQHRQAQQQQQELNKLWLSSGRLAPPHLHGALSPLPTDLQILVANSQPSTELLSRPEAQAILQGLRQGEITPQHLVQQLQDPAMQPRHREVLASILKVHSGSPRPASPLMVPSDQAFLQQLMLQQQLRIPSPMPPMHNGLPHRVPSPRELMLHTQTIMQSALIKKKLEEQQESFRKRQEVQRVSSPNVAAKSPNPATSTNNPVNNNQPSSASSNINNNVNNTTANNNVNNSISNCSNNSNSNVNSNNNNASMPVTTGSSSNSNNSNSTTATKSPTPFAFTPTSVLRKMTAEQQPQTKDGDGNRNNKFELIQAKLRQNELMKIQAAQSSRFLANSQLLGLRPPQQQWPVQKPPFQQSMQQGRAIVKGSGSYNAAPPPGTGLVDLPYGNSGRGVYPQRSKLTMANAPLSALPNFYNSFPTPANRGPPNRDVRNSFHQFLPGSGGDADLSISPTTSNQLAHWFTPELLAQAQAQTRSGKANSTINMVSVEELERLQHNSAPVLN